MAVLSQGKAHIWESVFASSSGQLQFWDAKIPFLSKVWTSKTKTFITCWFWPRCWTAWSTSVCTETEAVTSHLRHPCPANSLHHSSSEPDEGISARALTHLEFKPLKFLQYWTKKQTLKNKNILIDGNYLKLHWLYWLENAGYNFMVKTKLSFASTMLHNKNSVSSQNCSMNIRNN